MKAKSTSVLLGVIGIYLLAPRVWVTGQDKQADGPAGLEGSWQFMKSKDGDGEWVDRSKDVLRMKHITRTHSTYLEADPESKQVLRGGVAHCIIRRDSFRETGVYWITDGEKVSRRVVDSTWHFKGEDLHLSWSDGKQENKQVWRRLAK